LQVLWHQMPKGKADSLRADRFSPDGRFLFLTGRRSAAWMTTAQDPEPGDGQDPPPDLDGKPAPGNPMAGKTGAAECYPDRSARAITEIAKTAPVVGTYTFPEVNLTPSEQWTSGPPHAIRPCVCARRRLVGVEHGPRGGDELQSDLAGKNYGWPLVSTRPTTTAFQSRSPERGPI